MLLSSMGQFLGWPCSRETHSPLCSPFIGGTAPELAVCRDRSALAPRTPAQAEEKLPLTP